MVNMRFRIDNIDQCPTCGLPLTRDEVDIGVGTMHGPARCDNCGWAETPQEHFESEFLKETGFH